MPLHNFDVLRCTDVYVEWQHHVHADVLWSVVQGSPLYLTQKHGMHEIENMFTSRSKYFSVCRKRDVWQSVLESSLFDFLFAVTQNCANFCNKTRRFAKIVRNGELCITARKKRWFRGLENLLPLSEFQKPSKLGWTSTKIALHSSYLITCNTTFLKNM